MLQLRNFSYHDTQLSRLNGPNFNQIPINRSLCPFISTARDGGSQHRIPAGPHYYPNRFEVPTAGKKDGANYATSAAALKDATPIGPDVLSFAQFRVDGVRAKQRPPKFAEHYNQAQLFYNSLSKVEQTHMVEAAQFELGRVDDPTIRKRMMNLFNEIDHDFGVQVAEGFGIPVGPPKHPNHGKRTDGQNAISMLSENNTFTGMGRKVAIFVLDGFDSLQVSAMHAALAGMGVIVQFIGARRGPAYPNGVEVGDESASGVIQTHFTVEGCRSTYFDSLFFPTGNAAYAKSLEQGRVIHFVREAFGHYKPIGAIGVAVPWLAHKCLPGSLDIKADAGERVSSKHGMVLAQDITDSEASAWKKLTSGSVDAASFGAKFADACAAHRHWERDVSNVAF